MFTSLLSALLFSFPTFAALPSAEEAARAASCQSVDYRTQLGPVRDQGGASWCFAYTAADLLTQKLGFRVSALGLAQSYFGNIERENQRQYAAAVNRLAATREFTPEERQAQLRAWRKVYPPARPLVQHGRQGGSLEGVFAAIFRFGICAEEEVPSDGGLSSAGLHRKDALCRMYLPALPQKVQDLEFRPYPHWKKDGTSGVSEHHRAALREVIHAALNAGRVAAISYNAAFLLASPPNLIEPHSSTIVGRVCTKDCRCDLLVRNSWGGSCATYREPFKSRCVNGVFSIPETEILKYAYEVFYLE